MSCFIYPRDLLKTYFPPNRLFDVDVVAPLVGGGCGVSGGGWRWWVVGGGWRLS